MIRIEGIPIVAARLAAMSSSANNTFGPRPVHPRRRGLSTTALTTARANGRASE
jgi:hypothetical protein